MVASVPFYAAVCWVGRIRYKDAKRLDKLVKKAGAGARLYMLGEVNNSDHPLYNIFMEDE